MKKRKNAVTLETVHTHTHTHTSSLQKIENDKIIKKYINKKDNIIMPCGYIDTG